MFFCPFVLTSPLYLPPANSLTSDEPHVPASLAEFLRRLSRKSLVLCMYICMGAQGLPLISITSHIHMVHHISNSSNTHCAHTSTHTHWQTPHEYQYRLYPTQLLLSRLERLTRAPRARVCDPGQTLTRNLPTQYVCAATLRENPSFHKFLGISEPTEEVSDVGWKGL